VASSQLERKAETRAHLLDAAARLFAERGVDAVSVDAVADAGARTSGAIYAHFGSKQGLLLALLDEWTHSLLAVLAAEFERSPSVGERLRAVAENVVVAPSPETRSLLLLEHELWLRAARDPEVAAVLRTRRREAHDRLATGIERWMDEGVVPRTIEPHEAAAALQALVLGLVAHHLVDPGALDTATVERALAGVLGVGSSAMAAP
jgi:AcrR family transcriptional regulator